MQGRQPSICSIYPAGGSLANEVAKARQHIIQSLQCVSNVLPASIFELTIIFASLLNLTLIW
jgi:hypothetical protein